MQDPSIAFDCFVLCIKNSFHSNFNINICIYFIIISSLIQRFAEQSYLFSTLFSLIFSLETTICGKREERKEKSEKNKKKRQSSVENCRFFLAEEMGFEPMHQFPGLRDFESRLFDHLSTAPYAPRYYISRKRKNQGFSGGFFAISRTNAILSIIFP